MVVTVVMKRSEFIASLKVRSVWFCYRLDTGVKERKKQRMIPDFWLKEIGD